MSSGVQELLADPVRLDVWRRMPPHVFVRLDRVALFRRAHLLVVVKTRDPIDGVPLATEQVGELAHCRLELLTCGGVPTAYVITAPMRRVRVRDTYLVISRRGHHVADGTLVFTDNTLGAVADQDAMVAFVRSRQWLPPRRDA